MRYIFLTLLLFTILFSPLYLSLPLMALYSFLWPAYELFFITILVDTYFGRSIIDTPPVLTVLFLIIFFITTFLKPYFTFYNKSE